jgi:hypothetical protein
MGLLLVLGLRPSAGPAVARGYAPARVTRSQRAFVRESLVTAPLATSAVQGDVSAGLEHKAAAQASVVARATTLAGLDARN